MKSSGAGLGKEKIPRLRLVTSREAALLLLHVFELRGAKRDKPMTRAKLTVPMLKALWKRPRLAPEFIQEVADWLLVAGWVFFYAGPTYAAVRVSAVANWPRVSSKSIARELEQIAVEFVELKEVGTDEFKGIDQYFVGLEHLLWKPDQGGEDDGEDAADQSADDDQ
jgi:hypothetical protein